MAKFAYRGTNKVVKRCPHCGERGPKELVEGPKRFNTALFIILGVLSCGIACLFYPLFFIRHLEAYCDECGESFSPE